MTPAVPPQTMGLAMRLGRVGLWTNQLNGLGAAEQRDVLQEVEGLGFGALWSGESATGREAFTHSALALAATERLVVATGVASIWARDASATASAQRVLAETFPGRFLLGLGVSHGALVGARGHTYDKPLIAMREHLQGMDAHPTGDLPPLTVPAPRVLGALGPAMLELARDLADGAHPFLVPPEHTALARDLLGPGKLLAPHQAVVLHDEVEAARAIARTDLKGRLRLPNYRRSLARFGFTEDDFHGGGSDALVERMYVCGDEAAVAARVAEHLEAGADHVALHLLDGQRAVPPLAGWRRLAALV